MQRNTGYFPTESLEPCGNRLFSRSALNEGYLFRGSLTSQKLASIPITRELKIPFLSTARLDASCRIVDFTLWIEYGMISAY